MKKLADLKITETLMKKAISEELYDKAVTNLNALLLDCTQSVYHVCLKIECLLNGFRFEEAKNFSAIIMKKGGHFITNPKFLCWRGKVLIYIGADIMGKKHFQ